MKIMGCDFHPSFQRIAVVDTETGEYTEKKLIRLLWTSDEVTRATDERGVEGPL
jgi:hypothetical protein